MARPRIFVLPIVDQKKWNVPMDTTLMVVHIQQVVSPFQGTKYNLPDNGTTLVYLLVQSIVPHTIWLVQVVSTLMVVQCQMAVSHPTKICQGMPTDNPIVQLCVLLCVDNGKSVVHRQLLVETMVVLCQTFVCQFQQIWGILKDLLGNGNNGFVIRIWAWKINVSIVLSAFLLFIHYVMSYFGTIW